MTDPAQRAQSVKSKKRKYFEKEEGHFWKSMGNIGRVQVKYMINTGYIPGKYQEVQGKYLDNNWKVRGSTGKVLKSYPVTIMQNVLPL